MVVFNALQTTLSGGIGRYSYELAKCLYELNPHDIKIVIRKEDLSLFSFASNDSLILAEGISNSKARNSYEQFVLPKLINEKYPDAVIHYPDTMAPVFAKNKVIITVHDLAFKTLKGAFTWKTTLWKNFITNLSIKKADKVIAITKFTESEIAKHYPNLNKNKVHVVYNGFNDFSKDTINEKNVGGSVNGIEKPYILTVSTISPRKNIDTLINAFDKIKNEVDHNLVVAGKNGWLYENIHKLVDDLGLKDRVIFTGGVNEDELRYLYKNAEIFVYPSFYEGFGLPPLEAMSYGVPCVVSNATSIPEVVGDGAVLFNPNNCDELSEKLLDLLNCDAKKEEFSIKGNFQMKKYSWQKCALETKKVYEAI